MSRKLQEIPESLLQGTHIHCRPVSKGPTIEAAIIRTDESVVTDIVIVCPAAISIRRCLLRKDMSDNRCRYPATKYIVGP